MHTYNTYLSCKTLTCFGQVDGMGSRNIHFASKVGINRGWTGPKFRKREPTKVQRQEDSERDIGFSFDAAIDDMQHPSLMPTGRHSEMFSV